LVCDSGVRKKPSEERGPKLIIAIRQPAVTIIAGVRQATAAGLLVADGTDIVGSLRPHFIGVCARLAVRERRSGT
jgi:hypothetical protein